MKIAAAYNKKADLINEDFETAGHFKIYEIENGEISHSEILAAMNGDAELVIGMLCMFEVDGLICGRVSEQTGKLLDDEGIPCYTGYSGNPDDIVQNLLLGKL